jgi:hypothetical protein
VGPHGSYGLRGLRFKLLSLWRRPTRSPFSSLVRPIIRLRCYESSLFALTARQPLVADVLLGPVARHD